MKQTTNLENIVTLDSMAYMGAAVATPTGVQYSGDSIKDIREHAKQLPQVVLAHDWYKAKHESAFDSYVKTTGLKKTPVTEVGSADLPAGAVGGIAVQKNRATLLGNRDFLDKIVYGLARPLGLDLKQGLRFYHDHEYTHSLGIKDELGVYTFQRDMYNWHAKKTTGAEQQEYLTLARAADLRVKEYSATSNAAPIPYRREPEQLPYAA